MNNRIDKHQQGFGIKSLFVLMVVVAVVFAGIRFYRSNCIPDEIALQIVPGMSKYELLKIAGHPHTISEAGNWCYTVQTPVFGRSLIILFNTDDIIVDVCV